MINKFENFNIFKRTQSPPVIIDSSGSMGSRKMSGMKGKVTFSRDARIIIVTEVKDNNETTGRFILISQNEFTILEMKELIFGKYNYYLDSNRAEIDDLLVTLRSANKYNI